MQFTRAKIQIGLTLIELLVVVAIIAILAGIAVVNFLQAQTRAKVSRMNSDLRTVATGIELYRLDYNTYPSYHYVPNETAQTGFSFHMGGEVKGINQSPPFDGSNPLSTPVAYLLTMPKDIFALYDQRSPETTQPWFVNWDFAIKSITGEYEVIFKKLRVRQGSWRLHSSGPDGHGPDSDADMGQIVYDPSNGTSSRGDVLRSQKIGQEL